MQLKNSDSQTGTLAPPGLGWSWKLVFAEWARLPVLWTVYFLAKISLHALDYLYLTLWPNMLLLIFAAMRVPPQVRYRRMLVILKAVISLSLAFGVAWRESWFPSLGTVLEFLSDESYEPGVMYMVEFVTDFFATVQLWPLLALLLLTIVGYRWKLPTTGLVALLLLSVIIATRPREPVPTLDDVEAFWAAEAKRQIMLTVPAKDDPPFDIIFIHVCSLSWDDLRLAGMESHRIFDQFDYLLTNFNSVSAYSEQAAFRLLQSTCGQKSGSSLENEAPDHCYLLTQLRDRGYDSYTVFNHDDLHDPMEEWLMETVRTDPIMDFEGLPVTWISYDGSEIFGDYATLEKWWRLRQASSAPRAVLYYNSLTMHDGVHQVDRKEWWKVESLDHFRESAAEVLADVERFVALLEESDHPALVVLIPEHGSALRNTPLQMSTLREIPLPWITKVPVGLRFTGVERTLSTRECRRVDTGVSYQAIAHLLSEALAHPPFDGDWDGMDAAVESMPITTFLSDASSDAGVVERNGTYFLYGKGRWFPLPDSQYLSD